MINLRYSVCYYQRVINKRLVSSVINRPRRCVNVIPTSRSYLPLDHSLRLINVTRFATTTTTSSISLSRDSNSKQQIKYRQEVKAIFALRVDEVMLSQFITEKVHNLNHKNIIKLFYSISKSNLKSVNKDVVIGLTKALSELNKKNKSDDNVVHHEEKEKVKENYLIQKDLGKMLSILKKLNGDDKETLLLVKTMSETIPYIMKEETLESIAVSSTCHALQNLSSNYDEVNDLVSELNVFFRSHDRIQPLNNRSIGHALFGLKNMTSDSPAVVELLSTLAKAVESSNCKLEGRNIAHALLGLKGMKCDQDVVKRLLISIILKIPNDTPYENSVTEKAVGDIMTPKEIGMSLNGLMNKDSHDSVVRMLLIKLTHQLRKLPPNSLDSRGASIIIYGLRSLRSKHAEVRHLLSALNDCLASTKVSNLGFKSGSEISKCLYGLKRMEGKHHEVIRLVRILTSKIEATEANVEMNDIELSSALYGLQSLPSYIDEVRELVQLLTKRVAMSKNLMLNRNTFKIAVFGLQEMSTEYQEVRDLLNELVVNFSNTPIEIRNDGSRFGDLVGPSFFGMREMSCEHKAVRDFISVILNEQNVNKSASDSIELFNSREIGNTLYGLKNMSSEFEEVMNVMHNL